jgi:hypothetical protein
MKISEEFPSKYLKSSDLRGQEVRVTMGNVEREEIGSDKKLVLYFKGKDKGMVLNKTNANAIGDFYGDDSDDWYDQPLILFSIRTEFQGKPVDGLRCRVPTARDNKPARREDPISSGPPADHPAAASFTDDEIPF